METSSVNQQNGFTKTVEFSDLSHIEVTQSTGPFELFRAWRQQAQEAGVLLVDNFIFATSDGRGRVSARSLILRQLDDDGFVMMTDLRSKKAFDLRQCPQAAMTFHWIYPRSPQGYQSLQVRVEGQVVKESLDKYKHLYENEPLYCKVRSQICNQGKYVEWEKLKEEHDRVLAEKLSNLDVGKTEDAPGQYVVYKLYPEMVEFYQATNDTICDRVTFRVTDSHSALIPKEVLRMRTEVATEATEEMQQQQEEVPTTFNNGREIKVGYEPQDEQLTGKTTQWVHYHVSA